MHKTFNSVIIADDKDSGKVICTSVALAWNVVEFRSAMKSVQQVLGSIPIRAKSGNALKMSLPAITS